MIGTLAFIRLRETVAHRAEFLLWLMTLTMPLVMLVFWHAVMADGAFGGYDAAAITAYFLAVVVAYLLTDCDAVWNVNEDIRTGTLSFWLLKPAHPFINYTACTLGEMPARLLISLPILSAALAQAPLADDLWVRLIAIFAALAMGLAINQALHILIGSVGFWAKRSLMLHRFYAVTSSVLSGAMFPLSFLPRGLQDIAAVLPFRFIIALPVELITGRHGGGDVWRLLALQVGTCVLLNFFAWFVWRRGVRRYEAYG
ncbi:ABC transporter permease [Sphingomonas zeae]